MERWRKNFGEHLTVNLTSCLKILVQGRKKLSMYLCGASKWKQFNDANTYLIASSSFILLSLLCPIPYPSQFLDLCVWRKNLLNKFWLLVRLRLHKSKRPLGFQLYFFVWNTRCSARVHCALSWNMILLGLLINILVSSKLRFKKAYKYRWP